MTLLALPPSAQAPVRFLYASCASARIPYRQHRTTHGPRVNDKDRGGANAGSGRKSLTVDHDNALHERIDSDRPGSEEAVAKMHARLAALRSVSPPGHLQAVGQRSRAARQQRGGGATSGAPAEPPVRSRGACGDEQSSGEPSWTAPGYPPRRLATGGRSAADGKRCSGAR